MPRPNKATAVLVAPSPYWAVGVKVPKYQHPLLFFNGVGEQFHGTIHTAHFQRRSQVAQGVAELVVRGNTTGGVQAA
jgi:hypothetical protein